MSDVLHAVVVSYWPNRIANVHRIVDDLLGCDRPPEQITVLDNNPSETGEWGFDDPRVSVLASERNSWTRGKFVAALMHPARYYLLCDDDTSVGAATTTVLLDWAADRRGIVSGYWGVQIVDRSFMNGRIIQPAELRRPVRVDAFHGRVMFMSFDAVVRMLAVEEWVRLGRDGVSWPYDGDDIIAGLANPESWALPLSGPTAFVDLDEHGQALQFQDGYFGSRDQFTGDLLAVLDRHPIPRW